MPWLHFFASLVLMCTAPSQVHETNTGKFGFLSCTTLVPERLVGARWLRLMRCPLAAIWLGIPARSRTCPPRSQTPLPLALMAACWAAPLQPARVLSLGLQLGAAERGFVNFSFLACWWSLLHACLLGSAGGHLEHFSAEVLWKR